jgi:hypothetical protein
MICVDVHVCDVTTVVTAAAGYFSCKYVASVKPAGRRRTRAMTTAPARGACCCSWSRSTSPAAPPRTCPATPEPGPGPSTPSSLDFQLPFLYSPRQRMFGRESTPSPAPPILILDGVIPAVVRFSKGLSNHLALFPDFASIRPSPPRPSVSS